MKNVYTDSVEEYGVLRNAAGLLDQSRTGLLSVTGRDAAAFLNQVSSRSVDFLLEGQCSVGLLLDEDAAVLAEVTMHRRRDDHMVELWHAQADRAREHLLRAATGFDDLTVADVSDQLAVLGVEGPRSFGIVDDYLDFPIASLAYRTMAEGRSPAGFPVQVSRTGVTGEYGYKLIVGVEHADDLRAELLARGAVLCGSDAVDICRMEMRFVNLERESDGQAVTPFDVGLQWMADLGHEFTGRAAMVERWESGLPTRQVCWTEQAGGTDLEAPTSATGLSVTIDDVPVGRVVHAVYSPSLGRVIGTARVDRAVAASGIDLVLEGTGRVLRTCSAPFLVPTSFGVPLQ